MIVAHVLTSLQIGGGERLTLDLASGQAEAGHQVMLVSLAAPPDGPLAAAFRAKSIPVYNVAKRGGFDPTLPLRLALLLRRHRVGVAHLHNRLPLIYGAPAGRLARTIVVHTRHGPRPSTPRQEWLLRGAGRLLDAYVAVSPELGDLARERRACAPEKISVIENGIDLAEFAPSRDRRREAREALGIPPEAWVIGSVGRFAPEKDFPLLVRAAAPLLGPTTRLVIVGDGDQMQAVRTEVEAAAVRPFVSLTGPRHDVSRLLAAFDVFVLSSRMEGLPLVVLEAMAAGLPVVATAVGGLPKLISDGETGFLVPAGDAEALRARLAALRENPSAARAMGSRARAHAHEQHARDRMVERYLQLYARLGAVA